MIPFFIEKIINAIPVIKFTYIDRTRQTFMPTPSYVSRSADKVFQEGYIKQYQGGEWQPYTRPMRPFTQIMNHDICARYYDLETLDGSKHYLCQHGVHVK